jgi:hypothetical protein
MPHEQAQIVAWRPVNGYWFDPHFPQHPTLHSVKGTSVIPRKIDSNIIDQIPFTNLSPYPCFIATKCKLSIKWLKPPCTIVRSSQCFSGTANSVHIFTNYNRAL